MPIVIVLIGLHKQYLHILMLHLVCFSLALLSLLVMSCQQTPKEGSTPSPSSSITPTRWEVRNDFARHFENAGTPGSILLYDANNDRYIGYDSVRCNTRFCPASTFKIFNSLVALETGVVKDESTHIPWDSVNRSIDAWNQDHTLRSAIKHSVVWFYQELARRIGQDRMQAYLDSAEYGNRTIGGKINEFWLDGSLRISQREQIEFLKKLHRNDLPFSQRTIDIVKDIMTLEKTDQWTYRGKTGWALRDSVSVGWFVGYLEQGEDTWFFATSIEMDGMKTIHARQDITREILRSFNLAHK